METKNEKCLLSVVTESKRFFFFPRCIDQHIKDCIHKSAVWGVENDTMSAAHKTHSVWSLVRQTWRPVFGFFYPLTASVEQI